MRKEVKAHFSICTPPKTYNLELNKSLLIRWLIVFSLFQDELVAVSEKSVLRVADLLDWLVTAETASLTWDRGTRAQAASDCEAGSGEPHPPGPGGGLDLSEIQKIRTELGNKIVYIET